MQALPCREAMVGRVSEVRGEFAVAELEFWPPGSWRPPRATAVDVEAIIDITREARY